MKIAALSCTAGKLPELLPPASRSSIAHARLVPCRPLSILASCASFLRFVSLLFAHRSSVNSLAARLELPVLFRRRFAKKSAVLK